MVFIINIIMKKQPKLMIELIPSTCHFSNVRTMVKPSEWNKIRKISYESANNKCEICGDVGTNQGYKHRIECHEVWGYDEETNIQKLIKLVSLCVFCHQVKHIGRTIKIGKFYQCIKQLAKVNKWTREQIDTHIAESFDVYKERSKFEWTLDLSLLNEPPYELNIDVDKKRIFEVRKYKKKRKKKKTIAKKATPKKATKKAGKRPPKKLGK